ncbi:unnamed protein product [Lactuca virosa]|uniref:RRM domain-containing protein n=1 Tax=Lactuca virosa TaxID=75947 RepID=A0AAU9P6C3_9ASTR|nr:unnamed protein product [Lactuca virosa]
MGFGFVIYGGTTAENSAMKAVEFDGMEFHGRVLTVKLDDGRRMKEKSADRARWIEGDDTPSRTEFGLMIKYYAKKGDMHRAREMFESMRGRGIEPNSHVFTTLIHAYAVGRDMEELSQIHMDFDCGDSAIHGATRPPQPCFHRNTFCLLNGLKRSHLQTICLTGDHNPMAHTVVLVKLFIHFHHVYPAMVVRTARET